MKACRRCHVTKPAAEFPRSRRVCLPCWREMDRLRHRAARVTPKDVFRRLGLTAAERAAVQKAVQLYMAAYAVLSRSGAGVGGPGTKYEGTTADSVLSEASNGDFSRWLTLSQAVRDIARIRAGRPLSLPGAGWRARAA